PGLGGCADSEGEPLPPGEKASFIVSFLVPEDAVDSLVFQVQVDTGSGEDDDHPRAPVAAEFRAEKEGCPGRRPSALSAPVSAPPSRPASRGRRARSRRGPGCARSGPVRPPRRG